MRKTFKFRLYPTPAQETVMSRTLDECRYVYNQFIAERKSAWESEKRSFSLYEQHIELPAMKRERPSLTSVHSQVLQNVAMRVDLAYKAFFRRCKCGERPGYPRFKGRGRYDSFTYPQYSEIGSAFRLVDNRHVKLAKVGIVKTKLHREILGRPKTCTVRRSPTGKWFVSISCNNVPQNELPQNDNTVGIDVGLHSFATLSTGEKIYNPRFFRGESNALAKAQRKHSAAKSPKTRKVVARVHERIANKREDFCHQHSQKIVDKFGICCVEDLSIKNMIVNGKKPKLSKSITDAAWGTFLVFLSVKAENAGRKVVKVNPAYTTQDCSACGNRQAMKLSERRYECPKCGLVMDRDLNAAKNILSVGLHTLA